MFNSSMMDVIIIGAGPAGARTAQQLALRGHDVLLLDKRATGLEPICCTGLISPECVREFEIDPALILRDYRSARLHAPGGREVSFKRLEAQAFAVDRSAFDRFLMSRAVQHGASLRLGATVEQIQILPDSVKVYLSGNQSAAPLTARSVVIAAGMNQRLTTRIGLDNVTDFAFGAQLDVSDIELEEVNVFVGRGITPGFFSWAVPTRPGQAKIGLMVRRHPVESMHRFLALLHERFGLDYPGEAKITCRPIPLKAIGRTYGDRVLVVGDAAGQTKTTTGGGLYYGLTCAGIAADTLHEALLRDTLQAGYLRSYEQAWHRRLRRDMFLGKLARKFILEFGDHHLDDLVRRTQQSGLLKRLLDDDRLAFDCHGAAFMRWATGLLRG